MPVVSLLCLLSLASFAFPANLQVTPGEPVERVLAAGSSEALEADLIAGGAWRLSVEQRGIDVEVAVTAPSTSPNTAPVAIVDSPVDRQGTESLLLLPTASGRFGITVRSREPGAPPGRYTLRLDALPQATERDRTRIAAELAMTRAGQRYREGGPAHRQALAELRAALPLWSSLGERREEARTLHAMAVLSRLTGATAEGLELGREALPLWQELEDRLWEAATRDEIGLDLWLLGRLSEARTTYEEALAIQRDIGDRYGEAVSLNNLCAVDLPRGELRSALACYERALPLLREIRAPALEAAALTSAGRAWDVLGEPDEALHCYRDALASLRTLGDRRGEARALNNLAVLDRGAGRLQEALARYGQALEIVRAEGDRRWQARILHNLGTVYLSLGEPRQALPYHETALGLWREVGDREGEAATLSELGRIHGVLGSPREALDFDEQALALAKATGDRRGEGITLSQMGRLQASRGEAAAARVLFEQALDRLQAVGDEPSVAEALCGLAEARTILGEPAQALPDLQRALAITRAARIPAGEARALTGLARTERLLGRAADARFHAEAAIEILESLHSGIGSPDLRAAFSETSHDAFELAVDLRMDAHRADPAAGHDRAALELAERARARTLVALLAEAGVSPGEGAGPELLDRRAALERRLSAKADRALRQSDPAARAALEEEQEGIVRELDLVEAEIRERSPGFTALTRPQPLSIAEIQALLDPQTILLSYALGATRSFLWAVTPDVVESFELPGRAVLETAARRVHERWSSFEIETRSAAAEEAAALGRLLLGPVADRLGRKRVAVVADGALAYIPFGALPVPRPPDADVPPVPLLELCEVVTLPSAAALAAQRRLLAGRTAAPRRLVILADPLFDAHDPRFARLPASRREAEAIAALLPPGEARLLLAAAARRTEILGDRLRGFRVLHFATHGVIDAERPALSGLALSTLDAAGRPQEGFLHLRDIYGLRLDADLVVLSGCRTALGRELRGEGLVGLTRGFLYAGVPRVIASLWRVEDRATAELMLRFYRALWIHRLPPAAALRAAQLSIRRERRWRDPTFWAGFVLQGPWD